MWFEHSHRNLPLCLFPPHSFFFSSCHTASLSKTCERSRLCVHPKQSHRMEQFSATHSLSGVQPPVGTRVAPGWTLIRMLKNTLIQINNVSAFQPSNVSQWSSSQLAKVQWASSVCNTTPPINRTCLVSAVWAVWTLQPFVLPLFNWDGHLVQNTERVCLALVATNCSRVQSQVN